MRFHTLEQYKVWILMSLFFSYYSFFVSDSEYSVFNGLVWLLVFAIWINTLRTALSTYQILSDLSNPSILVVRNHGQTKYTINGNGSVSIQGGLSVSGSTSPDTSNGGMQIK